MTTLREMLCVASKMRNFMKKLLVCLFAILFINNLWATGIDSGTTSADCDSATLGQTSGTVNLEMDWQPNTIQIRWYNGNTLINTTNTNANSCVYGDDLYLPTAPTKKGYTFEGWEVRPQMDFGAIPTTSNGNKRYAKGEFGDYCTYDNGSGNAVLVECDSQDGLKELQAQEWKTSFSHGDVYGMSVCSITAGEYAKAGIPTTGAGQYCWCKVTGYKATSSNVISAPLATPAWVYCHDRGDYNTCSTLCSTRCAYFTKIYADFRGGLFTSVQ